MVLMILVHEGGLLVRMIQQKGRERLGASLIRVWIEKELGE